MSRDQGLGVVLRDMRKSRSLTLAAVAREAGCAPSLISYVETGQRELHAWLAVKLDSIYETGGVITSLVHETSRASTNRRASGPNSTEMLIVELPGGGGAVPLSRRDLLVALGVGISSSVGYREFESKLDKFGFDPDMLSVFEKGYAGFQTAARALPSSELVDGLTGNVALLDGMRRRAEHRYRTRIAKLQARYAESLSWLAEEAGDLTSAMYWIDRTSHWAESAEWKPMIAYGFVRRSMIAVSFANDGRRAVDHAQSVLCMKRVPPRIRGLAAKQISFGYALAGDETQSKRALDDALTLLAKPVQEGDAVLGQRSVVNDDLFTIFKATCDIYLGRGESVIPVLEPRLSSLSGASVRTATITRAKLARAYANAGQPAEAAHLAGRALSDIDKIESLSAKSELRRALPILQHWHGRDDVRMVMERLANS
ncbi:helix-turn-helix protein [Herbihabitans rhizosphaerae]|uniref:Helix-turn-helix protein n=1 Tax=Herbihabitans rhizosphaerae TaxID=1872711 RepID=A0A4Q7KND1_9PSEU|nr:helix-turn-helix transcriptional regulator [Herbihabitans rhizosphaerae]RZS37817.1 helix-turn-helix protein [Herbihabitans rhizosphaerae]